MTRIFLLYVFSVSFSGIFVFPSQYKWILSAPPSNFDPKFIHITRPVWMHVQFHHKLNLKYFFDYTQYVRVSLVLLIPANIVKTFSRLGLVHPLFYCYFICHQFEEAWNWKQVDRTSLFFYYDCNSIFLLIWYLFMGKHRWFSLTFLLP